MRGKPLAGALRIAPGAMEQGRTCPAHGRLVKSIRSTCERQREGGCKTLKKPLYEHTLLIQQAALYKKTQVVPRVGVACAGKRKCYNLSFGVGFAR